MPQPLAYSAKPTMRCRCTTRFASAVLVRLPAHTRQAVAVRQLGKWSQLFLKLNPQKPCGGVGRLAKLTVDEFSCQLTYSMQ
eukprot:366559-Chlamydomonas_euryale.AAC.21